MDEDDTIVLDDSDPDDRPGAPSGPGCAPHFMQQSVGAVRVMRIHDWLHVDSPCVRIRTVSVFLIGPFSVHCMPARSEVLRPCGQMPHPSHCRPPRVYPKSLH